MEENAKKILLIVVAVACLAAAGIITYKTMGGGTTAGQPTGKVWVKCNNPKCGKVFFPGTVEGKAEDTCPGCGYSPSAAPAKKT